MPEVKGSVDVIIPAVGVAMTEATVSRWLVEVGDSVIEGQALAEVETDKAMIEIEAPAAGTVVELVAGADETVDVGTPIARISVENSQHAAQEVLAASEAPPEVNPGSAMEPFERPREASEPGSPAGPSSETPIPEARSNPQGSAVGGPLRRPHASPPRVRFATAHTTHQSGLESESHRQPSRMRTEPGAFEEIWTQALEATLEKAQAEVRLARAQQPLVSLTDAFVLAVARSVTSLPVELPVDMRLLTVTSAGPTFVSLPDPASLRLTDLALSRREAKERAWASEHAHAQLSVPGFTVAVATAGSDGADRFDFSPPSWANAVLTFGTVRPRPRVSGGGLAIRDTTVITLLTRQSDLDITLSTQLIRAIATRIGHG